MRCGGGGEDRGEDKRSLCRREGENATCRHVARLSGACRYFESVSVL